MDLLLPHTGTIIWMTIGFSLVFFLLAKYAWKPILNSLKERDQSIEKALNAAEKAKKDMKRLESDNEKIILKAKMEHDTILKEARELKDSIMADAKVKSEQEAIKIIEQAKLAVKKEKDLALKDIKEELATLSVYIAEKILQEKLAGKKENEDLISRIINDIKVN